MAWWRRRNKAATNQGYAAPSRDDVKVAKRYLQEFVSTRRGVEAYVEPATNVTATTVILIAHDGEWTRRAMPSREAAFDLARELQIPTYDVNQTGYPQRMRDWTARQRRS